MRRSPANVPWGRVGIVVASLWRRLDAAHCAQRMCASLCTSITEVHWVLRLLVLNEKSVQEATVDSGAFSSGSSIRGPNRRLFAHFLSSVFRSSEGMTSCRTLGSRCTTYPRDLNDVECACVQRTTGWLRCAVCRA